MLLSSPLRPSSSVHSLVAVNRELTAVMRYRDGVSGSPLLRSVRQKGESFLMVMTFVVRASFVF